MVAGEMTCIKYLMFSFNLLFAVSGVAILTVGAIIHASYHHYFEFIDPYLESAPIMLIIVGVIVFVVAFFGCCGAVRENHCMVLSFSVFLLLICILELIVGFSGYLLRKDVERMLEGRFNESLYNYYTKKDVEKTWNIVQHEMKCCGIMGPQDWEHVTHNESLPYTCCPDVQNDGSCTQNNKDKYNASCLEKVKDKVISSSTIIGGVGIAVGLVQIIGIVFACFLARSIRREYETV